MKPYYPRKRAKNVETQKQQLRDLEHRISSEVNALILLCEEGNEKEVQHAKLKAKSGYLKHSDEMQKIAQHMGERYAKAVRNYLESVDHIVHSNALWIDEAKVRQCYQMTQQLEKEITAA
jgi:hypothetical protein